VRSFRRGSANPVPPPDLHDVGGGDFEEVGNRFLDLFQEIANLKASDDVLDMGCGVGRMAVPLARYLDDSGSYAGFDVVGDAIDWCSDNVAPLHSNFEFTKIDLYNKRYNPEGRTKATDFRFPYPDDNFDFVLATSLFTHLLPEEMKHYLSEASRVVRSNGTLFLTFFLLNDDVRARKPSWVPALTFEHALDGCRINNKEVPEAVVAYEQEDVEAAFAAAGLTLEGPIHYGSWSGVSDALRFQDVLVARS
jgi:SAM-dependent methyltransferase